MILRLARRVPPALAAHGPGRPAFSAAAREREVDEVPSDGRRAEGEAESVLQSTGPLTSSSGPSEIPSSSSTKDQAKPTTQQSAASDNSTPSQVFVSRRIAPKRSPPPFPTVTHLPPAPKTSVEAAIASHPPPSPSDVLALLSTTPKLLTSGARVVDAYAERLSDTRARRELRGVLRAERLSVSGLPRLRSGRGRVVLRPTSRALAAEREAPPHIEQPDDAGGEKDTDEASDTIEEQKPKPRSRHARPPSRANIALAKRYPPLPDLPARVEPTELLRHQHYLHLIRAAIALPVLMETLSSINGTGQDTLGGLHLELAYSTRQPEDVLEKFAEISSVQMSRQTLHAAVLSKIRLAPHAPFLEEDADVSEAGSTSIGISGFQDLFALIPHRTPGPETWRHIALYALDHEDAPLAQWAFENTRVELARERAALRRRQAHTPLVELEKLLEPQIVEPQFVEPQLAEPALSSEETAEENTALPPMRFAHVGRHASRWERALHAMRDKGWVVRGPPVEDCGDVPRSFARWRWVDRGEATTEAEGAAETESLAHRGRST